MVTPKFIMVLGLVLLVYASATFRKEMLPTQKRNKSIIAVAGATLVLIGYGLSGGKS